jgi:hypothetical protein
MFVCRVLLEVTCCDRILDPSQDAFWICNYLIEYLGKQVSRSSPLGFTGLSH